MKLPQLILIRGLPGSGKSLVADAVAQKLGRENCVVLDPDASNYESDDYKAMAAELKEQGVDEKFYPYRFLRRQAHDGIANDKIIIWNQAFTNLDGFQKTVNNLRLEAEKHEKELPFIIVEVVLDPAIALDRVARRAADGGHDVPPEVFKRFVNDYKSFKDEGFTIVTIDGDGSIEDSVNLTIAALD